MITKFDGDDTIYSGDIDDRIQELAALKNPTLEEVEERRALRRFRREVQELTDAWVCGVSLIADSYFPQHAEDEAEALADTSFLGWPYRHIDWEAAAEELKSEYESAELDDETYWVRCC